MGEGASLGEGTYRHQCSCNPGEHQRGRHVPPQSGDLPTTRTLRADMRNDAAVATSSAVATNSTAS